MANEGKAVSISQLCRWSGLPRSTFYYRPATSGPAKVDRVVERRVAEIKDANPRYGMRRIHAVLKRERQVNRKKVHRIIKLNGWQVRSLRRGGRPRAQGRQCRQDWSNVMWAIDTTHIYCGKDGWCHLTAVIDCCDRSIVGWRFSKRGVAKIAAAALEDGIRNRSIEPHGPECPILRSDNGLVFGSRVFRGVVARYGLVQEYITPYMPQQNGIIERFFRSLKEECIWLQNFDSRDHGFIAIADWIDKYHNDRPHSALKYRTPAEYYGLKLTA